jgi:polyisoprenoid-binding protein YceI
MIDIRNLKPLIVAAGLVFSLNALAAEWQVVPETSSVGFIGTQQGTRFNGRFAKFSAKIDLDLRDPTKGSIVGVVETASVNTRDQDRDSSLVDKDWFDSKTYPEARFESESIERADDGSYKAMGKLTLKGQTKSATLKFTLDPAETSAASATTAQFNGTMLINRFDFNVGEGWNDTSWVAQDVTVDVKLDLKK